METEDQALNQEGLSSEEKMDEGIPSEGNIEATKTTTTKTTTNKPENTNENAKIVMTQEEPQRPYMAFGFLKKGNCDFVDKRSACTNTMRKHQLDTSISRKKIPQYGLHSRMRPTVNYGQNSSIFGWYDGNDAFGNAWDRHAEAGHYEMPWRSIMLKDGDRYGPRRLIRENAKLGGIPNYEHDTCLYFNRSEQFKYNNEDNKRVTGKIKYPGYPEASKLIFPPIYANKSKYQLSQRKAMGRILNREQFPGIFLKKDLLESLPDCPDLPSNQRPA